MVVRSEHDHFPAPSTFTTSERVDEFFNLAYSSGLDEFAWRLEAYCLSGVHGKRCDWMCHYYITDLY